MIGQYCRNRRAAGRLLALRLHGNHSLSSSSLLALPSSASGVGTARLPACSSSSGCSTLRPAGAKALQRRPHDGSELRTEWARGGLKKVSGTIIRESG